GIPQLLQGANAGTAVRVVRHPRSFAGGPNVAPPDGALPTVPQPFANFGPVTAFPGLGNSFAGFTVQFAPPDTNAAVGSTQVVETVNVSYEVFTKSTGAPLAGPFTLVSLFGTTFCATQNVSDPVVEWDQLASRWLISYVAFNGNFSQ